MIPIRFNFSKVKKRNPLPVKKNAERVPKRLLSITSKFCQIKANAAILHESLLYPSPLRNSPMKIPKVKSDLLISSLKKVLIYLETLLRENAPKNSKVLALWTMEVTTKRTISRASFKNVSKAPIIKFASRIKLLKLHIKQESNIDPLLPLMERKKSN